MKVQARQTQQGIALLLLVFVLLIVGGTIFLSGWNSNKARQELGKNSAIAMREAKDALIAHAISPADINATGRLPLPDIGVHISSPEEGFEAGGFLGNNKDFTVIGKLPWLSLDTSAVRDQHGECLWYAVSGRFKTSPETDALNWDTQGQIDVVDGNGTTIANNIVAIVIAPGSPLEGQNRALADAAYKECGGNYQASNYLDPGNSSHALAGHLNYFPGSINSRVSLDTGNKTFVMANNQHFNDQFLLVTIDDIFRPIMRRSDFSAQITNLLNDNQLSMHIQSLLIAGPKGTDNLDCKKITENLPTPPPPLSVANESFCKNWKEMLFVTENPTPTSPACKRVIIFAGQKKAGQNRTTLLEKQAKTNYLEPPNLTAFDTPVASSNVFGSTSTFSATEPWFDIVKCVPAAP